jgi:hypothetical protein
VIHAARSEGSQKPLCGAVVADDCGSYLVDRVTCRTCRAMVEMDKPAHMGTRTGYLCPRCRRPTLAGTTGLCSSCRASLVAPDDWMRAHGVVDGGNTSDRHCQGPHCSAELPAHLDQFGPRGWHEVIVVLRPLGETHGRPTPRPAEARALLCPVCVQDPKIVGALALRSGMQLRPVPLS